MTDNKHPFLTIHVAYAFIWVAGILWALLSEGNLVPTEYITHSPTADYNVSLISIVTAIGGTYLALRLMALKRIRQSIANAPDEAAARRIYVRWAWVRLGVMAAAVWTNVVLYYATSYSASTQYCLLIALIGAVFCRPSAGELNGRRTTEDR